MPFSETPTRANASDLTEFYETNLKKRIEEEQSFRFQYEVRRSDDSFNITDRIVHDLFAADIVLCDLSGDSPNPNVMYELGVRLAVTNKPVILIRESGPHTKHVFDIQGFFAFEYSPNRYRELEEHLIAKIRKFESGQETYASPVLKTLQFEPSVVLEVKRDRAAGVIRMLALGVGGAHGALEWFVDDFLQHHHDIIVGEESTTIALLKDAQRFSPLDWHLLPIRPRQLPPAVHMLLTERVFEGLLSPQDEEKVNMFITRYYASHYAVDAALDRPTFADVIQYMGETMALAFGLEELADSVESTSRPAAQRHRRRAIAFLTEPLESVVAMIEEGEEEAPAGA